MAAGWARPLQTILQVVESSLHGVMICKKVQSYRSYLVNETKKKRKIRNKQYDYECLICTHFSPKLVNTWLFFHILWISTVDG